MKQKTQHKLTSKLTPKKGWRDAFIDALSRVPNVSGAARKAGISRQLAYQERGKDAGFRLAWNDAIEQSLDHAEGEMYRRAVNGVEIPHLDKDGNLLFTEKRYSDTLLIFMLKSHRRSIYGDRVTVRTWRDDIIDLLRDGTLTPEQVSGELGDDLATELIAASGIRRGESREAEAAGDASAEN